MKFPHPIPVKEIAQKIGAQIIGDDSLLATGINEIHKVEKGDICFSDLPKYFQRSLDSEASIIILNEEVECPEGKAILVVDNPFEAYDGIVREHRPFTPLTANISETAEIHPSTIIEPNVVISHHVKIGKNCYIQANSYIGEYTVIGDNVNIQAGAIIGTDAFYYKRSKEGLLKWQSGGRVVIEDHVEIGAGCTINKGVSGDTHIGAGSKFDSQIHIGHGAVIGKNCLLAAQVGIGGKTIVGDNCVFYGQVGIAQNLVLGDNIVVLAKSGVSKNLQSGKTYFGAPAEEVGSKYKQLAALRHLPHFLKQYYE
jgi:UDP-3-O-[3-hydroxymyristoyl] glucosamine N-acyltransferase